MKSNYLQHSTSLKEVVEFPTALSPADGRRGGFMSRPGFHEDGTAKRPDEWTLAEYIATREEFDGQSVQTVYRKLLERGRIKPGTPIEDVSRAYVEAKKSSNCT